MSKTMIHSTTLDTSITNSTGSAAVGLVGRVRKALRVRAQRRALLSLDARMLADIGISQADAWQEANRSVFDNHARPIWSR